MKKKIKIDPRIFISEPFITCPKCNHRDKRNRISQEQFSCLSCGYSNNADFVGAKNVLIRFLTGTYGSSYKPKNVLAIIRDGR